MEMHWALCDGSDLFEGMLLGLRTIVGLNAGVVSAS